MTGLDVVDLVVPMQAAPQGSKRAVARGVLVESSARVGAYRDLVTTVARGAARGRSYPPAIGIRVAATFLFARPASHYSRRAGAPLRPDAPTYPTSHQLGDVDKLVRATLDGLSPRTGWALIPDDSQVVDLVAIKAWQPQRVGSPAVHVRVSRMPEEP